MFYISYNIQIEDYKNDNYQIEILIKLFFIIKYNINLKDLNMNYIKEVRKSYDKILKSIHL